MNSRTRSQSKFDKIVEKSKIDEPLGHKSVKPIHMVKLLITQYNKKLLSKEEFTFEITQLLLKSPELLRTFRTEFYKNGLNIALKNNYMNSPYYTIKPLQKTSKNRNTVYRKSAYRLSRKTR